MMRFVCFYTAALSGRLRGSDRGRFADEASKLLKIQLVLGARGIPPPPR